MAEGRITLLRQHVGSDVMILRLCTPNKWGGGGGGGACVKDWMSSVVGVCLTFCQHKKLAKNGRFGKNCKIAWDQTFCLLECKDMYFVR